MDKKPETISYFAHESIVARMERTTKRLFILCLVIFAAFVGTNLGWVIYENSFEEVESTQTITQEVESDGEGDAIIHGDYAGAVINGASETDDNYNN